MRHSRWLRSVCERSRLRRFVCLLLGLFITGVIFLSYLCPDWLCVTQSSFVNIRNPQNLQFSTVFAAGIESVDDPWRQFHFDGNQDILVFLHIQKTGGSTFGRHLVRDAIGVPVPCECRSHRKRCNCTDERGRNWLFSRYSTGWVCGLHADWTELHECVPNTLDEREAEKRIRRYLYFTVLRDPVQRYISEWKHVQRGSTWQSAKLMCNGRQATLHEVPFCFQGKDWAGVSLEDFMNCQHNLANNRQTRMLANLTLVGCYDRSIIPDSGERDRVLLSSAMENLRQMAFFGLTEHQADMRYLFERTFGIKFRRDFTQFTDTHASKIELTDEQLNSLRSLNRLDVELYRYASQLFTARVERARVLDLLEIETGSSGSQSTKPLDQTHSDVNENEYNKIKDDGHESLELRHFRHGKNFQPFDG